MKKIYFYSLALAALSLGSCSSDDVVVADSSEGSSSTSSGTGTGYLNVSINLPTTSSSSTRADSYSSANDQYDDGEESEYAVRDAALILFKGANDGPEAATFLGAYELDLNWTTDDDDASTTDNITRYANKVVKLDDVSSTSTDTLYALVVLNRNDVFHLTQKGTGNGCDFYWGASGGSDSESNQLTTSNTFLDFMKAGTDQTNKYVDGISSLTKKGIFMTNAVLVNKSGAAATTDNSLHYGTPTIYTQTLVPINKSYIYDSETDANNGVSNEICVERAVAKVEVVDGHGSNTFSVSVDGTTSNLSYTINAWELANTNSYTYLVRRWGEADSDTDDSNISSDLTQGDDWYNLISDAAGTISDYTAPTALRSNPYRFAGTVDVNNTSGSTPQLNNQKYRTYWAIDPNYNSSTYTLSGAPATLGNATDSYAYCLENTFSVANQTVGNTTSVIVEAQLDANGGSDGTPNFYTSDGNSSTLYLQAGAQALYASKAFDKLYADYDLTKMQSEFGSGTVTWGSGYNVSENTSTYHILPSGTVLELTVSFSSTANDNGCVELLTDDDSNYGATLKAYTDANKTTLVATKSVTDAVKDLGITMYQYTAGKMYYNVLIKHFGDDLTPWNTWESLKYTDSDDASYIPSVSNSYPANSSNDNGENCYLGRYGVLRNNWYQLSVDGIAKVGSAVIPDVTATTQDDNIESYINIKTYILSWAKRTQGVTLQ